MKIFSSLRDAVGRLPIGRQMHAAFLLTLLLTAVVGGVALNGLARVEAQAEALAGKWLLGAGKLAEMRAALVDVREFEVKHSRTADKSYRAEYEEKIGDATKTAAAALAAYDALVQAPAERELFDKLSKGWATYTQAQQRVVALGRGQQQQEAADISDGVASMGFDEALSALNGLTTYVFDGGKEAAVLTGAIYARARLWMLGLLGAAVALGIVLAHTITRHLLAQLGGEPSVAAGVAKAVAEGNLTTRIHLRAGDQRSLMARLDSMQQGLAEAVTNVRQGSENVAVASAEIAQGNQDLSNRTEQQAAALEQTAATMAELGATVRTNADNAKQANQLAQAASTVAVDGGAVVGQVVDTMRGINDSSRKIADIIAVIDGIAFQTNILALNAAVEAARAGEQGRGFAVVAAEVRSLAQRSAEAAKEIKTLIHASVERVGHGTALVDKAGQTMSEIVGAIKRVSDIVGEISAASVEQNAGVAQVGEAITQMDRATQQNAALVEQSAAAAESMKQQAQKLVAAVAVFKLGHADRSHPAAHARPAVAVERRGPNRATNVARLKPVVRTAKPALASAEPVRLSAPAAAANGTDDWESF